MPKQYYKVSEYKSRQSIGYLLRTASKLITTRLEVLFVKEDVSFVQWVILMHLREGLANTVSDLSQRLCHDSGALTRVVDQMEERNMLTRLRSTEDRRVVELEITKTGRDITNLFLPRVVELYNHLLGDFSQEEADMVVNLLTRLNNKLSEPVVAEN